MLNKSISTPIVLTIAGSDSGGGAGIQADIKAISATGVNGITLVSAICHAEDPCLATRVLREIISSAA